MSTTSALHIMPIEGGAWAVKLDESAPASSTHPTRGEAVATAFEMIQGLDEAEVIVHEPGGQAGASLIYSRLASPIERDGREDEILRAQAERITPRRAQLDAMIARGSASTIDYSREDDELPC